MTHTLTRSLLTLAAFGAITATTFAQFPGGGGGGDRGGRGGRGGDRGGFGGMGGSAPDSEAMWNRISQGKDSVNLNDPANSRMREMMSRQGQALPPNGILTKNDFKVNFERQMAQGGGRGGRGGPGGMGGGPGGPQMQTTTVSAGPNGQMMMSTNGGPPVPIQGGNPAMMGGMGGDRGDRGGRGGFDPSVMTDDQIKSMMARSYELDPAGRISMMAAQTGRGSLKDSFTQFDMNRDGFIDSNEYRGVLMARMNGGNNGMNSMSGGMNNGMNNFQPGMNGPQGFGGASGFPSGTDRGSRDRKTDDEEAKPVVYRFGNLPKEVPSWFEQQDTDRDGQIGLYEWRSAKKSLSDFEEYDLNGDGYVTAEEWLRKQRVDLAKREEEERMSKPAGTTSTSGGRGGASFGSMGGGGRGGPGGASTERTGPPSSGRNPFTGAGGPPGGGDRGGRGGPPGGNGGGERGGRGGPGGGGPGGRGGRGGDRGGDEASIEIKATKDEKKAQKDNRNPKD